MKKIAVIDLGTNTCSLTIAKIEHGKIEHLLRIKESVIFGKEGINKGIISNEAKNRAYNALKKHKQTIMENKCSETIAIATSAIRSAKNASNFIDKIYNDFGIKINVISGNIEADLIYEGVKHAVKFSSENYLILDIGGGSNEFIIANKSGVIWKHSFNLGVARLLEKYPLSNPAKESEINTLNHYLKKQLFLLELALQSTPVTKLVGAGGVFTNFMMMAYNNNNIEICENNTANTISLTLFHNVSEMLIKSTKEQRLNIAGLDKMRIDFAVIATLFTNFILQMSGVNEIIQSAYDIKEGLIFNFLDLKNNVA